ncbi:DUF305 domain-containing protein [Nocardioides sp. AX2bis]|uniref:DUF305 domain-containing protein n=1 Tax=Nocardioides sp. AX2bis TaxID=2653157 RepID=UPI0012F0506D|nr:DUF305 domain-containing protein [Nocardioides sp. AX2bis]VXB37454.1 conserved exported hypothetical protein [Nocardioides sp. AX2bis]
MLPGPRTRVALVGTLVPLTLALAACGDDTGEAPAAATSTAPNGDVVSSADVTFARELIPHHAEALVMVDLTLGRDLDPRVADLVERLRAEHTAQVQTMSGWLTSWGEPVPETARDHANAHAAEDAGADAAPEDGHVDLSALEQAQGEEFEAALLTAMVEHHAAGIALAEAEVADGEFGPARELAAQVVDSQERETEQMRTLLEELGG